MGRSLLPVNIHISISVDGCRQSRRNIIAYSTSRLSYCLTLIMVREACRVY